MTYTKYTAAAVALLAFATPALANPVTDSITRQWDYTAPATPNAPAPRAASAPSVTCLAGQTALMGTMGAYCEGLPAGMFVQVDTVPSTYNGRVFRIISQDGSRSGDQGLGW